VVLCLLPLVDCWSGLDATPTWQINSVYRPAQSLAHCMVGLPLPSSLSCSLRAAQHEFFLLLSTATRYRRTLFT